MLNWASNKLIKPWLHEKEFGSIHPLKLCMCLKGICHVPYLCGERKTCIAAL
ncbi:hypothetical protein Hanom_Chr16g01447721 [Helianthus anomalus]